MLRLAPSRSCSSSSARRGWPETCTRCVRSVMTSMPWSIRPLMTRADRLLVAGNGARGEDHRSPLRQRHLGMLVLGDARERGARLALAAGAQRHHLVGRQIAVDLHAAELAARRRDSRSRARPATTRSMARPTTTTSRPAARAASATARMRADVGGEGRDRDAAAARRRSVRQASWRRRLPTASGPRAPHWWNRRSARGSPPRRARAAWPRRSAGRGPASDRSSSRRCAARCRAACG